MWRAVRNFPSRPASGESLTTNCILIVGGSMSTNGTASAVSESVSVSPIKMSSKPATPTMLPALASLISILARPAWERILVTVPFSRRPSLWMQRILSPMVTLPPVILP